jgi:hypothetical protein
MPIRKIEAADEAELRVKYLALFTLRDTHRKFLILNRPMKPAPPVVAEPVAAPVTAAETPPAPPKPKAAPKPVAKKSVKPEAAK